VNPFDSNSPGNAVVAILLLVILFGLILGLTFKHHLLSGEIKARAVTTIGAGAPCSQIHLSTSLASQRARTNLGQLLN
jgi:hypothetical protein